MGAEDSSPGRKAPSREDDHSPPSARRYEYVIAFMSAVMQRVAKQCLYALGK